MLELKDQIRAIERNESFNPNTPHLWRVQGDSSGIYLAQDEHGNTQEISKGDILTDFSWGIGYILDPDTTPRLLRKEYAIALARYEILQLTNRQILMEESRGIGPGSASFAAIREHHEAGSWDLGHQAEVFVTNYLKKIVIDHNIPLEILDVDVFEDVEDKIDFIVQTKQYTRGVGVEIDASDNAPAFAVQFTLMDRKNQVLNKQEIMRNALFERGIRGDVRIDDAVLLYLNERYVRRAIGKWKHKRLSPNSSSPPPGGPETLFESRGQKELLHRLLDSILGVEYVDELCMKLGVADSKPVSDHRNEPRSKKMLRRKEKKLHKKTM